MDLLSSRRRRLLAVPAAAVAVIIVAVAVIIGLQPGTDHDHDGHEVAGSTASASASATAETSTPAGGPSAPGDPAEPSAEVVESPPTAAVEGPAGTGSGEPDNEQAGTSLSEAAAEPERRRGSEDLGTPREPVDPTEVIGDGTALGGCLAEYGENGQCLPVIPPSMGEHAAEMAEQGLDPRSMQHPWTCAEVRTHFPDGIAVRTTDVDPQSLDGNGDGTACGAGD